MPEAIKVLGQANPAAATLTALYTVPASTQAVASTLAICERGGQAKVIRVSIAVGGAADSPEQYILYGAALDKNGYIFATIGLTLGAGDVVRVYSDKAGASFSLFGTEIS